ncbi:MAG: hypothetical protein ABSA26_05680 [Thermoguttaceae bacterium]|jgi:hypothetical protein
MPLRRILLFLFAMAFFALSASACLSGAELYGWIHGCYHGPAPYYIVNPKNMDIAQTAPHYAAERAIQSYPAQQGEAGLHAYPYGYFGAQSRPYSVSHVNYYHDFSQWSFRRGY